MKFLAFLRDNARWLAGGFLLTLFSSFGQTFFIALWSGHIREEYGLSNGGFGTLYMVATLASALTLPRLGQIVDTRSPLAVTLFIVPMLAVAAAAMALSPSLVTLALAIYLLRLFGQGMMTHNAFTAVARWFVGQRGRALSITAVGQNAGEATFPFLFVSLAGVAGWRGAWLVGAAVLLVVALPLIAWLVGVDRKPRASDPATPAGAARHWTRSEVLRDPVFYALLIGVLAPGFIGTTIFFHQVYLVDLRGWSLQLFAAAFPAMSVTTVIFALASGQLIDRFSAVRLLPGFLVPLGLACIVLAVSSAHWSPFVFMGLMGISYGFSSTLFGALWPEVYGVKHLGAIRSLTIAVMVFATAMGPGLTGYLIDRGVDYPAQIFTMGLYCFAVCGLMLAVSRRIAARSAEPV
jgi:MFS family permease